MQVTTTEQSTQAENRHPGVVEALMELAEGEHVEIHFVDEEPLSGYVDDISRETDTVAACAYRSVTIATFSGSRSATIRAASEPRGDVIRTKLEYAVIESEDEDPDNAAVESIEPSPQQQLVRGDPDG